MKKMIAIFALAALLISPAALFAAESGTGSGKSSEKILRWGGQS